MKKKLLNIIWFFLSYVIIYSICVLLQVVYLKINFWLSLAINLVSVFTLIFIVDLILKKLTKDDKNIQK
jgi:hypothetical protein